VAKIIGIDLGTTNSVCAVMEGGEPTVIASSEGGRLFPSVVAVNPATGERVTGQVARRQAVVNPQDTIYSVKRFMGRKHDDPAVQRSCRLVPYEVREAPNGDVRVVLNSREYSPPEISYFDDNQRQATKDAGRIAGLEVLRIINEPTASSLAYGMDEEEDHTIAVYDLGGGTFDISILTVGGGLFEVEATNGDTFLGGDDYDQRVIDWAADGFQREHGIDLRDDRHSLQRLREAAEKARVELSSVMQTEINLPFITADASGPRHLLMSLTRAKLEQLTDDLIERTIGPCRQALQDANLAADGIDQVVLVGGMTRMPAVQDAVSKLFGRNPYKGVNPDEVVAIGAAIQAGVLSGDVTDVVLTDVTPLTFSIETLGGVATAIIERNTHIPIKQQQVFSTASDMQKSVEIHVVQGERAMATDNMSLGKFILAGIPPAPRGVPQIEVAFDIDADGILNVGAKDRATGREQQITIQPSSGLDDDEIERMVEDAEQHAAEDRARKEAIATRNQADSAIYSAERALKEHKGRLSQTSKDEIEASIAAAREALDGEDLPAIQSVVQELQTAVQVALADLPEQTPEADEDGQEDAGNGADDGLDDGEQDQE